MEARLYCLLHERLPQTTVFSVGHRAPLQPFHHRQLFVQPDGASGVTSKAANGGHFKTGQRKWPGTRLFYSVAS